MTGQELDGVSLSELRARRDVVDGLLVAEGSGHVVHDLPLRADGRAVSLESRPWRLDPIPYVIDAADFEMLEAAVRGRMEVAEAILADLYGPRHLVRERLLPPAPLWGSRRYRAAAVGVRPTRWLTSYALDVVRDTSGAWHAIQELTDAPAGLGYALMNRAVINRLGTAGGVPRSLRGALLLARRGLADASTVAGPRIVTFTGGIDHASYIEHSYLATQLGFNLVEGADLVVRQRRLWLRTLAGLEPIDVVHRRLEDELVDPLDVATVGTAGVPSILLAAAAGNVAITNAYGSGLVEEPELAPFWDVAGEALTGHRPTLTLPTAAPSAGPLGGVDAAIGAIAERVPRLDGDVIVEQPLVVRLHAIATADGVHVVPGGTGRVVASDDDPRRPTPCVSKDIWVMGPDVPIPLAPPVAAQVDLIASVPTRAADSLFWLGRAAERAEALARALRVVLSVSPSGREARGDLLVDLLTALARPGVEHSDDLGEVVAAATADLANQVGSLLAEASSVREFLSATTGRVLAEMVDARARLGAGAAEVDVLDEVLLQLSAFAGLWSESVVRGPAWYYGDFARRLERAIAALSTTAMAVRRSTDGSYPITDPLGRYALEYVLATNDSLVAYRRRHRSDVEVDAVVGLLVLDDRNPRSVAASLRSMRTDLGQIGFDEGTDSLDRMIAALPEAGDADALSSLVEQVGAIATRLSAARLVVPPDPAMMSTTDTAGGRRLPPRPNGGGPV